MAPDHAGTHNWYTGNDNSRCWSCHVITGKAPKDFHSESMSPAGGEGCLDCHTVDRGSYPAINITSFSKHKNVNRTDEDNNLSNGDCLICHYDFNFTVMLENGFTTLQGHAQSATYMATFQRCDHKSQVTESICKSRREK